jgi:hypothetical protein
MQKPNSKKAKKRTFVADMEKRHHPVGISDRSEHGSHLKRWVGKRK